MNGHPTIPLSKRFPWAEGAKEAEGVVKCINDIPRLGLVLIQYRTMIVPCIQTEQNQRHKLFSERDYKILKK